MIKVFLDSDVVISSLISSIGASHQLINNDKIICMISNISYRELLLVVKKLKIEVSELNILVKKQLKVEDLSETLEQIKLKYKLYVKDINDAHIVAGAAKSQVNYLITYNLKDFKINGIKEKCNIKIMTPGMFLQFLRSK